MKFMIFLAILFPAAALSVAFIPSTTTKRSLFRATTTLYLPSLSLRLSSSSSTAASNSRTTNLSRVPIVICPGFGNDSSDYTNPLNKFLKGKHRNALRPLLRSNSDAAVISASQRAFATLDGIPKTNGIAAICDNDNCSSNYIVKS